MSAPLTGFEQHGRWTTLAEETALLTQIATETDAVLAEAGRTVDDRPIHRIDIGTGPNAIMFIGLQHASEAAGRESVLKMVRDLAYSDDPDTADYLAAHRVVIVPNVNADVVFWGRENRNGVNLNRDWFHLTQPETRAAHRVIRDVSPQVIMDLHESGMDHEDWVGRPTIAPAAHPDIATLGESLYDAAVSGVVAGGYTGGRYPDPSTLSVLGMAAGGLHAVGLLAEPLMRDWSVPNRPNLPIARRVAVSDLAVRAVLDWHEVNTTALAAAQATSMHYAMTTTDPVEVWSSGGAITAADISGYRLQEPLPQYLVDAHGIVVDGDFVSVNQPARLAVTVLCDPESAARVVAAARVARRHPLPKGDWADTYAVLGRKRHKILSAWTVQNGRKVPIRLPQHYPSLTY